MPKAIALQLDYKSRLHKTHKKTTNIMKIAKNTEAIIAKTTFV